MSNIYDTSHLLFVGLISKEVAVTFYNKAIVETLAFTFKTLQFRRETHLQT